MSQLSASPEGPTVRSLPRNVKVLGAVSLANDIATEMIFPLLPAFLLAVLSGRRHRTRVRWRNGGVAE
jgi:hypothetical protein